MFFVDFWRMIHLSEALRILNDMEPHDVVFVSKNKGIESEIKKAVVLSSNYERKKFNLKSTISNQIRWVYYLLIVKVDGEEVYL